jgi:hypothetical protein
VLLGLQEFLLLPQTTTALYPIHLLQTRAIVVYQEFLHLNLELSLGGLMAKRRKRRTKQARAAKIADSLTSAFSQLTLPYFYEKY